MPEVFDGDSLGKALAEEVKPGDRVLIPRALKGNQQLVEALKEVPGVQVDDIGTYETVFEHQGLMMRKQNLRQVTLIMRCLPVRLP